MAYRADIEIAVRGAQELKRLQNEISGTSKLVDHLNNYLENLGSGGVVRSINNLRDLVSDAAVAFNKAALGTDEANIAAKKYVTTTDALNAGLRERAALLKEVTEAERKAKLAAVGVKETTQYRGPIGPGAASPVGALMGQKSPVSENIQRNLQARQDENKLQQALLQLEQKSATILNAKVQSQEALVQGTKEVLALLDQQAKRQQFLAGKSGTAMQGPLAGPGAMGFPVALSLTAAEQKGLRTETQKQQILQRMAATRQQLVGLAANLQRLDQNSAVAIADATRAQEGLNAAKQRELQIAQQVAAIRNKESAASAAARQRLTDEAARRQLMQNAGFGMQGPALPPTLAAGARRSSGGGIGGRVGGAISGSIIGGAFPLLFGQGGGAAAGGAIGGLVGGLAGPGGSFAGSLLGTLLGDIASRGQAVKQLADDIGFSAQQTKQLSDAFKVANTDVEKFTGVIQNIRGVGLAIEDQAKAIQLVTRLTEAYGGSFEKTGNAITSTLDSGKVTQATLNQLTSQGINIQQALADKYNVSRTELLQMAKDGEISAQSLIDTLVEVANAGTTGATKVKNSYEETATAMTNAFANATTSINTSFTSTQNTVVSAFDRMVKAMSPALVELAKISGQIVSLGAYVVELGVKFATAFYSIPGTVQVVATALANMIPGLSAIYATLSAINNLRGGGKGGLATSLNLNAGMDGANWPAGIPRPGTPVQSFQVPSEFGPTGGAKAKGPKPPEDRTAQLQEDLDALMAIRDAEDKIRDALFAGREFLALSAEEDKARADIERDRVKAILSANYESEKTLINKVAQVRIDKLLLEIADKERAIRQNKFEEELQAAAAVKQSVASFVQIRKEQEFQAQYAKTYNRLITEGMLPAEAERIANYDKMIAQQLDLVTEQIKITDLAILKAEADGLSTNKLKEQLQIYKDQQAAIKGEASKGPGKGPTDVQRLQDAVTVLRGELNDLTDPINQVIAGAKAIGDAFQQAFTGLVTGAMTGQEALAAFFKSVGQHFLDMATKMIAKLIEIYILETVLGFISGAAGAASPSSSAARGTPGALAPNGAAYFGPAFAEGGFVTGPTRAIVGEGGEAEYVIPASKMRGAMSRYAAGARGASVIPGAGGGGGGPMGGGGGGAIDVRYTVERINSVDYVTADQFQRGMAQAAQQGAVQGEQRAMRSLKTSAATRRSVGI